MLVAFIKMILFLDFDGVLHPIGNHIGGQTDFSRLPLLEDWLRKHPDVNIVISSSWREVMDLDVLQHIFSEDLHHRVIDKCPLISNDQELEFYRYEEILTWLKHAQYQGLWLALDDATHDFPPNFDLLVACQKTIGIDQQVIDSLSDKHSKLSAAG